MRRGEAPERTARPVPDDAGAGLPAPTLRVPARRWPVGAPPHPESRTLPEETPVALSYDGSTHAVMMASPSDLHDFAIGFSLTGGQARARDEIIEVEIAALDAGIDLRIWLAPEAAARQRAQRRHMAGPTGCGLCGVDSLAAALPPSPVVTDETVVRAQDIAAARAALHGAQALHAATRAVHGAGLWRPGAGLVALREDVGRHNALDKLLGALARRGDSGAGGILVLTSRVSVEMVHKCAVLGAPVLVAVSAPTALAVRAAEAAGITLVARARDDGFDLFTAPWRIAP